MKHLPRLLAGIACISLAPSVFAQSTLPQSSSAQSAPAQSGQDSGAEAETMDIVVTGARIPGAVIGDIAPEVTLRPGDIRSYGVTSVSELVTELAAQTGSGQGRGGEAPIVLLNGGRISSFSEVRDIPTEAIARAEILPEEVALKYGYRATQKVLNIVLRRRFKAISVEMDGTLPTEGGQWEGESENSLFRTGDKGRLNLALEYTRATALTEAERDIVQQAQPFPYATAGNVSAISAGAEIDPALSLLKGGVTAVAGVPSAALSRQPTLADFAAGAVNTTDIGAFRTLKAKTDALTVNAVYARPLSGGTSLSLNAGATVTHSAGLRGLGTSGLVLPATSPWSPFAGDTRLNRYVNESGPLDDRGRDWTGHLGATLNGDVHGWAWTLTANADHADARSRNETGYDLSALQARITALDPLYNPYGPVDTTAIGVLVNTSRSIANSGDATLVLTGAPFRLPAGKASLTVTLGGKATGLDSRSLRNGVVTAANLFRREGNSQLSLDLPITSRREGVLAAVGDVSVNLNAGYDQYSDAGGQRLIGAGLTWSPIKPVSIIASWTKDEGAPTIQQLGNPVSTLTGVRVYDFVNGETVDLARITGGNPLLASDDRRVIKLGVTLKPFAKEDLSATANFTDSLISDPIAGFPAATAAIQAAFPARFTRDSAGRLTAIDARPVNFAAARQKEVRWGINFSKQLAAPKRPPGARPDGQPAPQTGTAAPRQSDTVQNLSGQQAMQAAMRAAGGGPAGPGSAPGSPGSGRPRGFGGPGGGGMMGTRMQVALHHTYRLEDSIQIAAGLTRLDLLNGDATSGTGGVSRHEVRLQGGVMHNGMGLRFSANWKSGTTVESGADALHFSDLATVNLRLFANLGLQRDLVKKMPFLRGTRISIGIDNVFNDRQTVTDNSGTVPLGFQPAYLDPLGRTISLSVRKLFF